MDFAVHAKATFVWSSMAPCVCVLTHILAGWVNQYYLINIQLSFSSFPSCLLQTNFSVAVSVSGGSKHILFLQQFNITIYRGLVHIMLAGQKNWSASVLSAVTEPHLISFHRIGIQEINFNFFFSEFVLLGEVKLTPSESVSFGRVMWDPWIALASSPPWECSFVRWECVFRTMMRNGDLQSFCAPGESALNFCL